MPLYRSRRAGGHTRVRCHAPRKGQARVPAFSSGGARLRTRGTPGRVNAPGDVVPCGVPGTVRGTRRAGIGPIHGGTSVPLRTVEAVVRMRTVTAAVLALLLLLATAPTAPAGTQTLANALDARLRKANLEPQRYGVVVLTREARPRIVFARGHTQALIPASTAKVLTAAAALDLLSPCHVFTTTVTARGRLDETGTLHGDLVVHGTGDPNLSGRFHDDRPTYLLEGFALAVEQAGHPPRPRRARARRRAHRPRLRPPHLVRGGPGAVVRSAGGRPGLQRLLRGHRREGLRPVGLLGVRGLAVHPRRVGPREPGEDGDEGPARRWGASGSRATRRCASRGRSPRTAPTPSRTPSRTRSASSPARSSRRSSARASWCEQATAAGARRSGPAPGRAQDRRGTRARSAPRSR